MLVTKTEGEVFFVGKPTDFLRNYINTYLVSAEILLCPPFSSHPLLPEEDAPTPGISSHMKEI